MRTTERLLHIAQKRPSEFIGGRPGSEHARVRMLARSSSAAMLVQDDVVAIKQRVFGRDAIGRRNKELHHKGGAGEARSTTSTARTRRRIVETHTRITSGTTGSM